MRYFVEYWELIGGTTLLVGPILAFLIPGDYKRRLRRALLTFLVIVVVCLIANIFKIYLSAQEAHKKPPLKAHNHVAPDPHFSTISVTLLLFDLRGIDK